jgi:hypothetical protein
VNDYKRIERLKMYFSLCILLLGEIFKFFFSCVLQFHRKRKLGKFINVCFYFLTTKMEAQTCRAIETAAVSVLRISIISAVLDLAKYFILSVSIGYRDRHEKHIIRFLMLIKIASQSSKVL